MVALERLERGLLAAAGRLEPLEFRRERQVAGAGGACDWSSDPVICGVRRATSELMAARDVVIREREASIVWWREMRRVDGVPS